MKSMIMSLYNWLVGLNSRDNTRRQASQARPTSPIVQLMGARNPTKTAPLKPIGQKYFWDQIEIAFLPIKSQ